LVVAVGLLFPGPAESDTGRLGEWLPALAHFMIFAMLAFLAYCSLASLRGVRSPTATVVVVCFLYGFFLELVQITVPGRGWEVADLVMNGLGIAVGVIAARGFVAAGDATD